MRKIQRRDLKTALFLWELSQLPTPPPMLAKLITKKRQEWPTAAELLDRASQKV